jgi:hypothetical protein
VRAAQRKYVASDGQLGLAELADDVGDRAPGKGGKLAQGLHILPRKTYGKAVDILFAGCHGGLSSFAYALRAGA